MSNSAGLLVQMASNFPWRKKRQSKKIQNIERQEEKNKEYGDVYLLNL